MQLSGLPWYESLTLCGPRKEDLPSVDLCVVDYTGRTSLHFAVQKGDLDLAKQIAALHPELVNQPDNNGETPLHVAATQNAVPLVELLIATGADPLIESNLYFLTPLQSLTQSNDFRPVIEELLAKGIRPDTKNSAGMTALHAAASVYGNGIMEYFVSQGNWDLHITGRAPWLTPYALMVYYRNLTGAPISANILAKIQLPIPPEFVQYGDLTAQELLKNLEGSMNLSDSDVTWLLVKTVEYIWASTETDFPLEIAKEFVSKLSQMKNGNPLVIFIAIDRLVLKLGAGKFKKEVQPFSTRAFELLSSTCNNINNLCEDLARFISFYYEPQAREFLKSNCTSPNWSLRRAAISFAAQWPADNVSNNLNARIQERIIFKFLFNNDQT